MPDKAAVPGVIVSIQTYGQELNYHPHRHAVIPDGCFSQDGTWHSIPEVDTPKMMELFRHKVFRMLLAQEKITQTHVEQLLAWRHTGFSVYRGELERCGMRGDENNRWLFAAMGVAVQRHPYRAGQEGHFTWAIKQEVLGR